MEDNSNPNDTPALPPRRPGRPRTRPAAAASPLDGVAPRAAETRPEVPLADAERPPMRQEMRAEDPRAAAERRAAEIFEHLGGDVDTSTDDFYIDPNAVPDGWTYEWKRHTVLNAPDPTYEVSLRRMGWTAVPASRHPEMMPISHSSNTITRKGMMLMERPAAVTERVKTLDNKRARDQVRAKEEQLSATPPGQFDRENKGKPLANVKKGYERITIPKE